MKAMILAAGFGTRLFPLTIDRTKPAIPFLGRPLIGYVAEYIAGFGIKDVVINLHHQPRSVMDALGNGDRFGVHIDYTLEQPEILGTSGALDNARHRLEDETFLIVNGKIITDIDLSSAIETHKCEGALATMVLKPNTRREKFTEVEIRDGGVSGFGGYPSASGVGSGETPLMFTGIHILEPRVFDYIPRGVYSDIVPTVYKPAIERGERIAAHITDANWFELSTIPRYLDISLAMMKGTNICVGRDCSVADSSAIRDSVLWDGVTVADDVILTRTIIADGVSIGRGERYENAAIVTAESLSHCDEVPEKALKGFYRGENYIVPFDQN